MKTLLAAAIVSLAIGLPSASHAADCVVPGAKEMQAKAKGHTAAETEIMKLELQLCQRFQAGELDDVMNDSIAEHGIVLLDGGGIANGREMQRQMFKGFFAAGYNIVWEPMDAKVSQSGDMAWATGMVKLTLPNGSSDIGKYVSVWEKVDGTWMNVIEMRNSNGGHVLD